jgi:hypothetical protein
MSTYDVVLLVEEPLSEQDAQQVRGLHAELDEQVRYHVLIPVEDAASRVETAMSSLAAGEILAAPALIMSDADIAEIQADLLAEARGNLDASLAKLQAAGADATGDVISIDPIDGLAAKVAETTAAEAIILTRPHVVAEFFHVDWTSRARRKLGVPVLHLLERETFDEQAGGGEGITGL